MRSFKTFLAEVNLGQIADLKPSAQSKKGRLSQKPPSLRRQADDPRQQLSRKRQLELGINLPSGEAKPAPGPELLVPGGIATAPTRAAMRTIPRALKVARDQPYKFLNRKLGIDKLRQKMPGATKRILPGTKTGTGVGIVGAGVYDSFDTLQKDVNEYLSRSGYADVELSKKQAFKAFKDLSTEDQTALAGSLNAIRDYYLPALGTGAAALASGQPLLAAVPTGIDKAVSVITGKESKPTLRARRGLSAQAMRLRPFKFGTPPATGVFSGENPAAARAGVNFINNVENMAKIIKARSEGMRQNVLYPGRPTDTPKNGITVDLDATSITRTPRTRR